MQKRNIQKQGNQCQKTVIITQKKPIMQIFLNKQTLAEQLHNFSDHYGDLEDALLFIF